MTAVELQCKAKSKGTGMRCGNRAMRGTVVCYWHGGASPGAQAKAAEVLVLREAERTIASLSSETRPLTSLQEVYQELLDIAGLSKQWREILQQRVSQLTRLGYEGITGEQVKADVLLFERAITRSAKITTEIARLNLEERKQALNERMAQQIYGTIVHILDDLELTDEQQERVKEIVPARMRELTA